MLPPPPPYIYPGCPYHIYGESKWNDALAQESRAESLLAIDEMIGHLLDVVEAQVRHHPPPPNIFYPGCP